MTKLEIGAEKWSDLVQIELSQIELSQIHDIIYLFFDTFRKELILGLDR